MNVKNVEKENGSAKVTVEIAKDEFQTALDKAYAKIRKDIMIPGFRKGKAPRKMIEAMYGAHVFYEDGLEEIFPEIYDFAIAKQDFKAIGRPNLTDMQIGDDNIVTLTLTTEVYPEVTLGQYKGLEVEKEEVNVTDEQVQAELDRMAQNVASTETVERPAKMGDTANIDFEGFDNGVPFEGGKGDNFDLKLGSGQFVPGFEEQIVGMKAGDERDVVVTFPENYVAELAGKEATFKVTVKSVKEPELPELDDELAKDISDYETIAEYRDHVREDLEKQFNEEQESDYATRLMKAAVDNMTVEIPEPMVLAKLDEQLRNYISTMGVSPELTREQVLASMGLDEKTFQEIMRPQAMFEISTDLLLDAIVKAENIELDEGELDEMYQKMADEYKMEVDQIKQYVDEKIIVLDMKRRKAAQLIRDTAVDKEPEAKEEPAEAKEEAAE